ncbi:hypothetical protein M422DRAFT_37224 [Sphaerobolus stellatus SS14]|uniref:DUF6533 domain-containing protein n=1 Tax=Sphaerobolus stellatus (strain SS14) TaxID=990650 RepID=A0A0C9U393_SPHS4|nr:hypothetical protein M422DRAFT_37224 [Sphaerobolus stellatus SS14]
MSSSAAGSLFFSEYAAELKAEWATVLVGWAAVSLLFYDCLLSFRREVKYVWSRPFRIGTVLYFLARYGTIAWSVAYAIADTQLLDNRMPIIFPSCGVITQFGKLNVSVDILSKINHFALILCEGIGLLAILVHTFRIYQTRKSRGSSNTSLVRLLPKYLGIIPSLQTAFSSLILCHFYMDLNSLADRLTIAESEGVLTTQVVPLPTLEERRPRPQLDGEFDDYLGDDDESIYGDEDDQIERRDDIESKLSSTEGEPQWTPNYAYTQFSDTGSIYEGHAGSEGKIADFGLV